MSTTDESVLARLQRLLSELLVLQRREITPEARLLDDLDADSITFIELAFSIEKEFGIRLPDVKADEETFALPLPDGLRKLESVSGGATFYEFLKHEAIRRSLGAGTAPDAVDEATREHLFGSHTVRTLAEAAGAEIPAGLDPGAPVSALRLRDFFRFLTVGTLAGYVEHLLAVRERSGGTSPSR